MSSALVTIFGLIGGLALFLFGMNMMSEGLQKAAGEKMKQILRILTKNRFLGVIAGALVTAVLQSSSATTVMAIGFVSAGLISLPQAISVIFGANIGTTITAQIIAFKISDYIYAIIFIGFIVSFVCKSEKIKNIGQTIFAFGVLFLGIETMGSVMKPLASSPVFTDMIARVADIPVLGVVVGAIMTLVVQSSSATIAVLQNFASQAGADGHSILGLTGAIPILLGDNIGTTITALLACIGQSRDAKRTAVAHSIFNISGALLFIWFIKPFAKLVELVSPSGDELDVISRQIANAHTLFNLTMTIIWVIFLGLMVKIVTMLIKDKKGDAIDLSKPRYLDHNVLSQPTAALQLVVKEVQNCSDIVKGMLSNVLSVIKNASASGGKSKDNKTLAEIQKSDTALKSLHTEVEDYLAELFSSGALTELQAAQTAKLMYVYGDICRMGVLSAEMANAIKEKREKKYVYSKDAMDNLESSMSCIEGMYEHAISALSTGDKQSIDILLSHKDELLDLDLEMRKNHLQRVNSGTCDKKMSASFMRILHCIDRMGNSCVNLTDSAINDTKLSYFMIDEGNSEAALQPQY
ncbi:MAG: Na/Pi cotransporter family protein [Ruminococcus sp.]|nr:Na/Pi cotransporter family protein [Ruminococcus sp.]